SCRTRRSSDLGTWFRWRQVRRELADRYAEGLVIGTGSWKDRAHQIGTKWQGANPRRGGNPGDRPGLQDRFPGSKALSSRAEVLELHDAHHALPDAAGLAHQRKAAGNDAQHIGRNREGQREFQDQHGSRQFAGEQCLDDGMAAHAQRSFNRTAGSTLHEFHAGTDAALIEASTASTSVDAIVTPSSLAKGDKSP